MLPVSAQVGIIVCTHRLLCADLSLESRFLFFSIRFFYLFSCLWAAFPLNRNSGSSPRSSRCENTGIQSNARIREYSPMREYKNTVQCEKREHSPLREYQDAVHCDNMRIQSTLCANLNVIIFINLRKILPTLHYYSFLSI